jgi:membrane fusion protein (multidrug efflux system)
VKELGSHAALDKAKVALSLGKVDVEAARVSQQRAEVAKEKTVVVSPLPGVVTQCNVRVGERVRVGDLLYRVEDLSSLVLHADIPVRQAHRIRAGNAVRISSTATPGDTTGEVILVAPTVDRESGTVSVKIAVEEAPGFRPGLFVTVRVVVARRKDALVVPKHAVLHDDEEGAYLFVVRDDRAARVPVETGFERERLIEIVRGLESGAEVVVEGQDTLTPDSKVEIKREE